MARGEAAGHIASSVEKQRAMNDYAQLSVLCRHIKRLTYGIVPATVRVGPLTLVSLIEKPPSRKGSETCFLGDSKSR